MKIFKIMLTNYKTYIVISDSIDDACNQLTDYLEEENLYFSKERHIKSIEVVAEQIDDIKEKLIYKPVEAGVL